MSKQALKHFKKVDPELYAIIKDESWLEPRRKAKIPSKYFERLCRIIVGQQLSGKAASAIWIRFETLFPQKNVTAKRILELDVEDIRGIGIAYAKVNALKDLAEKVASKQLVLPGLQKLSKEEIHNELIVVKGIGPWTIEMFLMTAIAHEDIFSNGDLGLIKGVQKLYNLKNRPSGDELDVITAKWSPYRSYAAFILWNYMDEKE